MAHLLIIDLPGGNDTDVVSAARSAGHNFSFLSSQLGLYARQSAVQAILDQAFERIEVPGFEHDEVERRVLALHQRLPIDAVLCLIDIRLVEASRLALRLGLPYLNPTSAALMRDKYEVRRRLNQAGLPQPEFELATSNAAIKDAVERLGLPVLVKPVDGYGSQNIVVLRAPEDLQPWIDPLDGMLPSRADYGLGVVANDRLLVERYMQGRFIGCDTLTVAGKHRLIGVHEKEMFEPPSFAIRGSTFLPNGSQLASQFGAQFPAIEQYVCDVLDAVGFDWGATHMELMITPQGPRVIEVNPRIVGAKMPRLIGHALGRSIYDDLIQVHLGRWPEPPATTHPGRAATVRWITAGEGGVLERIDTPTWTDPAVCCVELLKCRGDWVHPPFENADRLGYVMTCAESPAQAEALADRYVADSAVVLQARSAGTVAMATEAIA